MQPTSDFSRRTNGNALSNSLNTYFMVFWITLIAGYLLILPWGLVAMAKPADASFEDINPDRAMPLIMMFYLGLIALIFSTIFWGMLHYQLWKLIPKEIARTTPGKAVGFLFIPLFNFYWVFVACLGLSKDLNATLQSRGIQHQVSEGLGLFFCILSILSQCCFNPNPSAGFSIIDLLGMLIGLIGVIISICFYASVKSGAIAFLEQEGQ